MQLLTALFGQLPQSPLCAASGKRGRERENHKDVLRSRERERSIMYFIDKVIVITVRR